MYDPDDRSAMSYSSTRDLDTSYISCGHRAQAGWPPGPPLPNGQRCSSGGPLPGQPTSVPGSPWDVTVFPGDGQLTVQWRAPHGGGEDDWQWLTSYTVSIEDGRGHFDERTLSDTRVTIAGLTNGVEYTIKLTANNEAGSSQPTIVTGTPTAYTTVPGPPTNVSATPEDGQAFVSWSRPSDDGGTPIIGYTITADDGSSTITRRQSPNTVGSTLDGLANGRSYAVTVHARNRNGDGARSIPVTVTPMGSEQGLPSSPTDLQVTEGDRQLNVTWIEPTDDGGAPIIGYTITADDGSTTTTSTAGARHRSYTITGLTNGVEYTIGVTANNSVGSSQPAGARGTPMAPRQEVLPGAPTNVRVVAGDRELSVSWSPPHDDGGSPVTGYVVTASRGSSTSIYTVGSNTRSYRIGGLTNSRRYTIWVHARNSSGDGPTSAPVVAFPMGEALPPDRPSVTAVARGNRIEANWSANDNGAPIDRWRIGGVGEVNAGTTSHIWADQSPGAYTIRVRAHNVAGWSPWGTATVTVAADPTVAISRGNAGPTSGPDVNQAPCAANDSSCRWINVSVRGFPQGRHTGRCIHQGFRWPNGNISAGGWWRQFNLDVGASGQATLTNPCYITFSALRGDGAHISVSLNGQWIDSNTLPPDTNFVLLNRGGPGPTTAPRPGSIPCAANRPDCRWLQIELRNFPPGQYRVYCAHDGWNNGQYPAGSWHNFETTIGSNGGTTITNSCYVNIPNTDGRGVRIHVGQASLPSGQYRWSSNWLR